MKLCSPSLQIIYQDSKNFKTLYECVIYSLISNHTQIGSTIEIKLDQHDLEVILNKMQIFDYIVAPLSDL